MPAINVTNSRGVVVATINVGTTTGIAFPVEIQGQGISPYGAIYGDTIYHLLENFARDTEPANPVEGMDWYKEDIQIPHFYNGTKFIPYITGASGATGLFNMLPTATNVDFTVTGLVPIFTAPSDGTTWHPTMIILYPRAVVDVTGAAQFNLQIASDEDVMENVILDNPDAQANHSYQIMGRTRFASGADTINLDVQQAAIGGGSLDLRYDVYLFGWNRQA